MSQKALALVAPEPEPALKYPVVISNKGQTVSELKETKTHTTYSGGSYQAPQTPSVDQVQKAKVKAEHAGFVLGAKVKIIGQSQHAGKIFTIDKIYGDFEASWFYHKSQAKTLDDVMIFKIKTSPDENNNYYSPYCMAELELA
jgi:hypothetical protein